MSTPALSSCRHTSHADTLPLMSTHTPSPHGRHTLPLLSLCRHTLSSSCLPLLLSSSCPPPHADTPSSCLPLLSSYRHTPNPSPPPLSPHTDTPSLSPHVDTASLSTCRHVDTPLLSWPPHLIPAHPHVDTPSSYRHTPLLMPSCRHTPCRHTLIPTHPLSSLLLMSTQPHTDTPSPPPYADTPLPSCPPHIDTALCRHAPLPLLISTRPYADTPSVLCALPAACCISLSHCTLPLRAVLLVRVSSCSFVRPVQMCKDHPVTLSTHTPSNSCDVHHMTLVTTQRQAACPCSRSTHYLT